jgi:hypothetical protein
VQFTMSLAAELAILNAALDEPGADIGQSLHYLAAEGAVAVTSYLGMSVVVNRHDSSFTVNLLNDGVTAGDIGTSIVLSLPGLIGVGREATVKFILYARSPGAFVDLAADLAWLTRRPLADFVLDEHLLAPDADSNATPLAVASVINQAIGVLIGRGYTIQRAHWELDTQAAHGGTDRETAARHILARLHPGGDSRFDIH